MNRYEHLLLTSYQGEVPRLMRGGGSGYKQPAGREKHEFSRKTLKKADTVISSLKFLNIRFSGIVNPSLIFEININQGVSFNALEKTMASMGVQILAAVEGKKGYWVVFSSDENLSEFKRKLEIYGSEEGAKYDFFHAIDDLRDIPKEKKIGANLKKNPLGNEPEFIDIELWRLTDEQKNLSFIKELKSAYSGNGKFRITDQLITKSFVLLRVKISEDIFNEIIELKEIARAERPSLPIFKPFDIINSDISDFEIRSPEEGAAGILVIDSGLVSNHPILEKCIGGEENFQSGERALHDIVGHGTAVAGCAAYGDIEKCIEEKRFSPSNWIFSAKVMYAEKNLRGEMNAVYDPEKLVENQLKEAVISFLSNPEFHIRVINISLGNLHEIWGKSYFRQLPLAALIDELACFFSNVVFVVSTGNQHPQNVSGFETINKIKSGYPAYILKEPDFKLINPATSALALTVGSISPSIRMEKNRYGEEQIKVPIAAENQPSPFTRSGPGINGMIKPELVEYGGNLVLYDNFGRISEDRGGKIALLNNQSVDSLFKFDMGTSFSAAKVAHIAGVIANKYPQRTASFVKNMLLLGAEWQFLPSDSFYGSKKGKSIDDHLNVSGFGLPSVDRAINSFDNRVVLFEESYLQVNKIKVYSLLLPEIFFSEHGRKKIIVTLTFVPETRLTRGDSYLGNRMEFHLFHSVNPQELVHKYGSLAIENENDGVPEDLQKFEIKLAPGSNKRNAGCHQKAWKEFKREPKHRPASPVSLVLINRNKWLVDENARTEYCLSVVFEHEKEIDLYNQIRARNQGRVRLR